MAELLESVERLDELISHWAEQTPDACACVSGDIRLSYAELRHEIDTLARALVASGIRKGDRVATLAPPSADFLISLLATVSIGGIWLGLNPRHKIEELKYVVTDSEPHILLARTQIGDRDFTADILALQQAVPALREIVTLGVGSAVPGTIDRDAFCATGSRASDGDVENQRRAVRGLDPCIIVYTSGSTGRPKGALLPHRAIARFAVRQNTVWPITPLVALNYFPVNHVACVCDISSPVLAAGGTIVFLEQFDAHVSLDLMQRERVTFWASVTSTFQMQFALEDFASYDLSSVQLIMWGGAAAPEPLVRRMLGIVPQLGTNYGMTETMITTSTPITNDVDLLVNTVGSAFPGTEIKLIREDGTEAKDGEPGEIWVRSEYNLIGYWNRPEATAEAITPDGFFKTGDVAVRRPDGNYRIAGRLKEMFKSGGYNVYPREIETVLEDFPAVTHVAVVSIADPLWDEVGVAFVIADRPISSDELEAHCRARLANYKVPKHFFLEEDLPLLPIGKIDKIRLAKVAVKRLTAD